MTDAPRKTNAPKKAQKRIGMESFFAKWYARRLSPIGFELWLKK